MIFITKKEGEVKCIEKSLFFCDKTHVIFLLKLMLNLLINSNNSEANGERMIS